MNEIRGWLLQVCEDEGIGYFNPNRDQERQVLQRGENSYFTYGQVVYRGRQTHLYGRWHIDQRNAMMFAEYGLPGVLEQARVTGLPVQEIARKSPGAGVTAMQMQTALRRGVLVPHLKQQAEAFKTVAELIRADRGGLVYQPLVGLHRWIVFLPSRVNKRVPVPNRYFGVFEDGTLKTRGIECNRHDTPPFIAKTQLRALEKLAALPEEIPLRTALPELIPIWRNSVANLRDGRLPLEELLVSLRVSRAPEEFRTSSPAARALAQLARTGRQRRPGQRVRFIYTRGAPGVHAWDLPTPRNPATVDTARYAELLVRAADTILRPLGIAEERTRSSLLSNAYQQELPFDIKDYAD